MYKYDNEISSAIHGRHVTLVPSRRYHYADLGLAEATAPAVDLVADFGRRLWENAPAGVAVAIYYAPDAEQTRRAIEWAARENAVGVYATKISVGQLVFGRALAADKITDQVAQLGAALKIAVARAPAPSGVTPLPGTGPHLIRTLALFTHGSTSSISVGINTTNVAGVIKGIAPVLTNDVKIIIYGCSAARGSDEREDEWVKNSMSPGGADSLAGIMRDALVDAGKSKATVWSHTEVGHTTRNPSLRYFTAGFGKGSAGISYAGSFIFGSVEKITALGQIEQSIAALGFEIGDRQRFQGAAYKALRGLMYGAYVRAVVNVKKENKTIKRITNLTLRGANLPEMAPLYPLEVADIVRKYWAKVWNQRLQEKTARKLIKTLRLKKKK